MFAVKEILVSDEIFTKKFVCDLNACKGACCVEGDAGAPLEEEELKDLERVIEAVKPFMEEAGIKEIERQGLFVTDGDGDFVTPLVDGDKQCIYTVFEKGIAGCSIERAYNAGKIDFRKPISCHLYPIRIARIGDYETVNYNEWHICKPACACGQKLNVTVFKFLKEPLIRRYGQEWYDELEKIYTNLKKE